MYKVWLVSETETYSVLKDPHINQLLPPGSFLAVCCIVACSQGTLQGAEGLREARWLDHHSHELSPVSISPRGPAERT